jgi:DNA-directed RNA polymerase specialized sigma24 family protein
LRELTAGRSENHRAALTLLADGKLKVRDAAAVLGVSERTLFRELRAERDREMVIPSKAPEMVS